MSRLPAAARREQLLDVAAELFAKKGYARATTAELANAAGVTEPIIYRHFASKRDLFVALIERTAQRTLQLWSEHLEGAQDPAERLRRVLADNPMVVSPDGKMDYRVFLQAITEIEDEAIHGAVNKHIADLHAFLEKEIARAQEARKVARAISAEMIAWMLIHVGLGYGILAAMDVPGQGYDHRGRHVQDVLERILVGRAAEESEQGHGQKR